MTTTHARTHDLHVASLDPLASPAQIKAELPLSDKAAQTVVAGRDTIVRVLSGDDRRLLAIVGPCSIHDPKAALEYARRLSAVREQVADTVVVLMRVYFEKPRTRLGWKGLISDPHLDGSLDMDRGLRLARELLVAINEMGLPTATEMLDPITPQYIADLVSWAAIGARTTESQTHRQMASGLSMPVGFKNATSGDVDVAIAAMQSARGAHSFLGIDEQGRSCVVRTTGNPWGHLILRGGADKPNYDPDSICHAADALRSAKLPPQVLIDCSHANSEKKHERQEIVWNAVIEQRTGNGGSSVVGLMLESNLEEGSQNLEDPGKLKYGVSITDACIGWKKTESLIRAAAKQLR